MARLSRIGIMLVRKSRFPEYPAGSPSAGHKPILEKTVRNLTHKESVGLIALLTLVTGLVGWSVLNSTHVAASSGITLREVSQPPPSGAPVLSPSAASTAAPTAPPTELVVHVAGAVRKPGLYHLPLEARNNDAILAAGGPTKEANTDAINLAAHVTDGSQLYVPTRKEQPEGGAAAEADTTPVAVQPTKVLTQTAATPTLKSSRSRGSKPNKLTDPKQGQIDLNTASAEELQRIPGVGPAMAARLLAFRQENHGFHSVEDLLQVSGIGEKKFAKMQPFVRVH